MLSPLCGKRFHYRLQTHKLPTPEITELFVAPADLAAKTATAAGLAKVAINKLSYQWLQVLAEGWASPLKGFMREEEFLKCLHFNQIDGVNQSVPIVLPIDAAQKAAIAGAASFTLTYEGKDVAIMNTPEVYQHIKEERIARTFGKQPRTCLRCRAPGSPCVVSCLHTICPGAAAAAASLARPSLCWPR